MSQHRSRYAIWNFSTALVFTIVTMGIGLFSSPLIESWIGPKRFGAFRSFFECFSYLALLELGLGAALGPLLARELGHQNRQGVVNLLAVGMRSYLLVAAASIAVGLGLTTGLPWLIPLPPAMTTDLRVAGLVYLICTLGLPLLPFRFLLSASQRDYRVNILLSVQGVGIVVLMLALTWAFPRWGITAQSFATAAGILVIGIAISWDALRHDRGLLREVLAARPGREVWRAVWALSWPSLVFNLSSRISLHSDSIVLGKISGVELVTILFFTQRLAVLAQGQLTSIGSATWAGLADLYNRQEHETFRRRFLELLKLVGVLGMAGLGAIVVYDRHFVTLWKGPSYFGGDAVILVACLNAVLQTLISISGWSIAGTGRIRLLVVPSVLVAAVNVVASVALTRAFGMVGPLLGSLVAFLVCNLPIHAYIQRREFGISPWALLGTLTGPLGLGIPYYALIYWWARAHTPAGWLGLAAEMGATAVGFLLLSFAVLLGPGERLVWRERFAKALPARWRFGDAE